MRTILLIISFLAFTIVWSQKGESEIKGTFKYKVTYLLTYQIDSTNTKDLKRENMELYIGDNISRFSSQGMAIGDSLMNSVDRNNKSQAEFAKLRAQIPPTEFEYFIFKGIPQAKISFTRKLVKNKLRYIEDMSNLQWVIKENKKEIFGYQARLATTEYRNRSYKAWFTPEIPISEGPYKFKGLPGLIIKISDVKEEYVFELQKFKKLKNPVKFVFDSSSYITTSKKKVQKAIKEYESDPIAALERSGMSFEFPPGQRQQMKKNHQEKMKLENNPIELE